MALIFVFALFMLLASLAGFYLGPGIGRDLSGGATLVFLAMIVYRVFKGGRDGKGVRVGNEAQGPRGSD